MDCWAEWPGTGVVDVALVRVCCYLTPGVPSARPIRIGDESVPVVWVAPLQSIVELGLGRDTIETVSTLNGRRSPAMQCRQLVTIVQGSALRKP